MRRKIRSFAAAVTAAVFVFAVASPVSTYAAGTGNATVFNFTDSGISVTAGDYSSYEINGTALKITGAGSYKVTGSCSDGSISVKKSTTGVTLMLSGLSLMSSSTAPLSVNKYSAADIIIEGTVTLKDSLNNSEDYLEKVKGITESDAENAVIKLKGASDVTISGSGTLNINAAAKNGIKSGAALDASGNDTAAGAAGADDANLTISGITLNIDAASVYNPGDGDTYGDGINAECNLNLTSGTYNIKAGDDAIHSDYNLNIGTASGGTTPNINITKATEGIEGALVKIMSGDIDVKADEDGINAANSDLSNYQFDITISGGDIYVVAGSDGDALDSNGTINISGGKVAAFGGPNGNAFDTGTDGNMSINSSFNVTGGTVFGLGIANMAVTPSSGSQNYAVWSGQGGMGMQGAMPGQMGAMQGQNSMGGMPGQMGVMQGQSNAGAMPGQMGAMQGQNGAMMPGQAQTGSTGGTASGLTLYVNGTAYSSGSSVSVPAGSTVMIKNGDTVLESCTAPNAAAYVIYSTSGLSSSQGTSSAAVPGGAALNTTPSAPSQLQGGNGFTYRMYNPYSGEHFYTLDENERNVLSSIGWNYEGAGFRVYSSGIPVYRLYNVAAGDHMYLTGIEERDNLIRAGWVDEGIGWYASPSQMTVSRLYNPNAGQHHFTTSADEAGMLMLAGWILEGVVF